MAQRSRFVNKERVLARLNRVPAALADQAEKDLDREADELVAAIKRAAPVDKGPLQASVRKEPGEHRLQRIVVAGGVPSTRKKVRKGVSDADFAKAKETGGFRGEFDYSLAVEVGHRTEGGGHVPAQPFFYPTYRARKRAATRRMKAGARKVLRKLFPRGTS